ncbi:hypothetical protein PB2503_11314 [Parvularcula bermudensis HTCC2503]|uniref:DUF2793 domain-containing protein n=1 Tax=Parvularcula bermudensis (strain ATCC BAA-594 / HTCC2503 / KCTC 12087) TaxID=314260 RepID=E0TC52_PARBH|nr:DUF2793 domain-containing protein [Parvularcula bermudensis]ADM10310.1 hypothetical protein PB2503_11314 [Parvularcula bermudensis HTCC2503]
MSKTDNLELPYLAEAQAMKHVTHNEALRTLDAVVHLAVRSRERTSPPAPPVIGERYIVPEEAEGAWAGHGQKVALWQDGIWVFHTPIEGWVAYIVDEDGLFAYRAGVWAPMVPFSEFDLSTAEQIGINTDADTTNKLAVKSNAILFSHDDVTPGTGDQRLFLNKRGREDVASILLQNDFVSRGEIGLAGDDDLRLRASPDGSLWRDAIVIDRYTGAVRFPNTPDQLGRFDADIYVDSESGDDDNDGRTATTPLKTLTAARQAALLLGDGVRLALGAGSFWRDSLDLSGMNNVIVAAHGDTSTLGLPEIRGDDPLTGPWSTSADRGDGHATIYSQPFAWEGEAPTTHWLAFWEHPTADDDPDAPGVRNLKWAPSLADCAATPGTFFVDAAELGADPALEFNVTGVARQVTVYLHPFDSTDPRTDGKSYHGITRQVGVYVGNDSVIRKVVAYRAGDHAGSLHGNRRCLFDRCLAFDGVSHQMLMGSGEFRDCTAFHNHVDHRRGAILIEHSATGDVSGEKCRWTRTLAVCTPEVRDVTNPIGFGGHSNGVILYDSWIIEDSALFECSVACTDTSYIRFERLRLQNGGINASAHGAAAKVELIDSEIVFTRTPAISPYAISTQYLEDPFDFIIDGLRSQVPEGITLIQTATRSTITGSILIVEGQGTAMGNTFALTTAPLPGGVDLRVERSVLISDEGYLRLVTDDDFVAADNAYGGTGRWYRDGVTVALDGDLATWQSATGQDEGSVQGALQIADPLGGDWTITGDLGATGAGLARPNIRYYSLPASIAEAKARLVSA